MKNKSGYKVGLFQHNIVRDILKTQRCECTRPSAALGLRTWTCFGCSLVKDCSRILTGNLLPWYPSCFFRNKGHWDRHPWDSKKGIRTEVIGRQWELTVHISLHIRGRSNAFMNTISAALQSNAGKGGSDTVVSLLLLKHWAAERWNEFSRVQGWNPHLLASPVKKPKR